MMEHGAQRSLFRDRDGLTAAEGTAPFSALQSSVLRGDDRGGDAVRRDGPAPDLLERLRGALAAHPEVAFAYLFGSAARGPRHRASDVDVAVSLGERREDGGEGALRPDLLGAVQRALGREDVDLVLLDRAPPLLAERIARTGTLICSRDEPGRLRWIVETKSRYCDLRPLRALLDAAVARRVRSGTFGRSGG